MDMSTVMQAFKKPKPKKIENPAFANFTFKMDYDDSYEEAMKKLYKNIEGVVSCKALDDGVVNISGYIDPDRLFSCVKKVKKNAKMVNFQFGECSTHLIAPKKDNGNEKGIEANYFYPGYYNGNGNGHGNGRWHGNGYENGYGYGYGNGYGHGNGQWHGNGHGNAHDYSLGYPTNERNVAHKHLECSGNAEDCDGHHGVPKEIINPPEEESILIPGENNPKCCSIM